MKTDLCLSFLCLLKLLDTCTDFAVSAAGIKCVEDISTVPTNMAVPRCHGGSSDQKCNYEIWNTREYVERESDHQDVGNKVSILSIDGEQTNTTLSESDLVLTSASGYFRLDSEIRPMGNLKWQLWTAACILPGYEETVVFSLSERLDPNCSCEVKNETVKIIDPVINIPWRKNGVIFVESGKCYSDIRNVFITVTTVNTGPCTSLRCNISDNDSAIEFLVKKRSGNDKHKILLTNIEGISYNTTYRIMVNCTLTDKCPPYQNYSASQSFGVQFSDTLICKNTNSYKPTTSTYKTIESSSVKEQAADGPTSLTTTHERSHTNSINKTIDDSASEGTISANQDSVSSLLLSSSQSSVELITQYSASSVTRTKTENRPVQQNYTSGQQASTIEYLFEDPLKIAGIATVAGAIVGVPLTAGIYYKVRKRNQPSSVEPRYLSAVTRENPQSGCAPSADSDQHRHPPSLRRVFPKRLKGSQGSKLPLCGQRRL